MLIHADIGKLNPIQSEYCSVVELLKGKKDVNIITLRVSILSSHVLRNYIMLLKSMLGKVKENLGGNSQEDVQEGLLHLMDQLAQNLNVMFQNLTLAINLCIILRTTLFMSSSHFHIYVNHIVKIVRMMVLKR